MAFRTESRPNVQGDVETDMHQLATWVITGGIAFMSILFVVSLVAVTLARGTLQYDLLAVPAPW